MDCPAIIFYFESPSQSIDKRSACRPLVYALETLTRMSTKTAKGRLKSANTGRIAGAPGARSNPWLLFIVLPRLARHEGLSDQIKE